jgi:hypothetical protein
VIGPCFYFEFKIKRLNSKTSHFDRLMSKKIKTSHLFYVLYFKFLYNYFLNFVVQKINSKIIKCEIVILTERDKTDVAID